MVASGRGLGVPLIGVLVCPRLGFWCAPGRGERGCSVCTWPGVTWGSGFRACLASTWGLGFRACIHSSGFRACLASMWGSGFMECLPRYVDGPDESGGDR